jgi:hypothetical protein
MANGIINVWQARVKCEPSVLCGELPEGAFVAGGCGAAETAVRGIIIAFPAIETARRFIRFFHVQLYRQYQVADGGHDDAEVDVHDRGVTTDVLIDDGLDGRDVLGDKKQAQILFSRYHETIEETRTHLELVKYFDGVLGGNINFGQLEADFHEVHAGNSGNDSRLLELADARAHRRLGEPDVLRDLDLGDIGVLLKERDYLSVLFIKVDGVNPPVSKRYDVIYTFNL